MVLELAITLPLRYIPRLPLIFFLFSVFTFETESHKDDQVGLLLTPLPRLALNLWFPCLCLLSTCEWWAKRNSSRHANYPCHISTMSSPANRTRHLRKNLISFILKHVQKSVEWKYFQTHFISWNCPGQRPNKENHAAITWMEVDKNALTKCTLSLKMIIMTK